MRVASDAGPMKVVQKAYDFALWTCQHTSHFPRSYKFVLGDRIERRTTELVETLIRAQYTVADREELLGRANLEIEMLRFNLRLARELQCLRPASFEFGAKSLEEVGRMVGGWLRSLRGVPAR